MAAGLRSAPSRSGRRSRVRDRDRGRRPSVGPGRRGRGRWQRARRNQAEYAWRRNWSACELDLAPRPVAACACGWPSRCAAAWSDSSNAARRGPCVWPARCVARCASGASWAASRNTPSRTGAAARRNSRNVGSWLRIAFKTIASPTRHGGAKIHACRRCGRAGFDTGDARPKNQAFSLTVGFFAGHAEDKARTIPPTGLEREGLRRSQDSTAVAWRAQSGSGSVRIIGACAAPDHFGGGSPQWPQGRPWPGVQSGVVEPGTWPGS